VKTYLDEHKVDTIHKAANLADDYSLTHRKVFLRSDSTQKDINRYENVLPPVRHNHDASELPRRQSAPICYYCK